MLYLRKRIRDARKQPIREVRTMNEQMLGGVLGKLLDMRLQLDTGVGGLDVLLDLVNIAAVLVENDHQLLRAVRELERANYGQHDAVITALEDVRRIAKLLNGMFVEGDRAHRSGEALTPDHVILRLPETTTVARLKELADREPQRITTAVRFVQQVYIRQAEPLIQSLRRLDQAAAH